MHPILKFILSIIFGAVVGIAGGYLYAHAGPAVTWLAGIMLGAAMLAYLEPVREGVEP